MCVVLCPLDCGHRRSRAADANLGHTGKGGTPSPQPGLVMADSALGGLSLRFPDILCPWVGPRQAGT